MLRTRDVRDATDVFVSPWSPRTPVSQRALNDRDLLTYRHPAERRTLVLGIVLLLAIFIGLMFLHELVAKIVLGLLGLVAASIGLHILEQAKYYGNGIEVTPNQFPQVYPIIAELRERWAMPETRVVIVYRSGGAAVASGIKEPYLIRVDAILANFLDAEELKFVIGREMAHIKFGHTRLNALSGLGDKDLPAILSWFAIPRDVILARWRHLQAFSADRAGVLACGKVSKGISALIKSRTGHWTASQIAFDEMGHQMDNLTRGLGRVTGRLSQHAEKEPLMMYRIRELIEWAGPPEPGHTLPLRDTAAFDPPVASGSTTAGTRS